MHLDAAEQLSDEIAVMKKLDHPHVVRLHEVIDDPEACKMLMVMEYVAGGSVLTGGCCWPPPPPPPGGQAMQGVPRACAGCSDHGKCSSPCVAVLHPSCNLSM
jgi:serine/threonine protein kinase